MAEGDALDIPQLDGEESNVSRLSQWGPILEWVTFFAFIVMGVITYFIITSDSQQNTLLTPALSAVLLVGNLVPAMGLLVLFGRRVAKDRAARTAVGGNGRLHVRLVALFSLIAAVPTLFVAIFASLLFQYGVDFWFSDRSRGMFENAATLAQGYNEENQNDVAANTVAMASDLKSQLDRVAVNSPAFSDYFLQQVVARRLTQSAIIEIGDDGVARTPAMVDPDNRPATQRITDDVVKRLTAGEKVVIVDGQDRFGAATLLQPDSRIYLYASRDSQILGSGQLERSQAVLTDYNNLFARSKALQLQFNIALFLLALTLVGLAVWVALVVADRLVSPVVELVSASHRVAGGDLTARVKETDAQDEVGTLATAFNRMTTQLEGQTSALLQANSQLESRRAFIEAVLSGVTSGVMSLDKSRIIRLANVSAENLLKYGRGELIGLRLANVAPELDELVADGARHSTLQLLVQQEPRTIVATIVEDNLGHIVTFEDITQQQLDQRRAAWSDVARRIAHEIKNPLTPIQLAAERLQRRYGDAVEGDKSTFEKLTQTIVRQVADLRRMVDEFSSFARMPKPVFREENIVDIAKQAMFLHEVAHGDIRFNVSTPNDMISLVCDRRQMAQLFTNVIKNAVEAIRHKPVSQNSGHSNEVELIFDTTHPLHLIINISDTGVGLPKERAAIVEPYMTTRDGGTGLGLAIVKKIVEEHHGEMHFDDRAGGGTIVTITLNPTLLALDEIKDIEPDHSHNEQVPATLSKQM